MTTTPAASMVIPILSITSLKSISLSAGLPVWLFRMRPGAGLGVTLRYMPGTARSPGCASRQTAW